MTKKLTYQIIITFVSILIRCSLGYSQITLQEAIEMTLERNLQIKDAGFSFKISEQDLIQSRSDLYPSLNLSADNSYVYGLTFDQTSGRLIRENDWTKNAGAQISSNISLFEGFRKINQIRANKIQLSVDATEVEKVKYDLTLSVLTYYLEAITNRELYEAAAQQVELSYEQLRQDSIQLQVGNKTLADLAQAENQIAMDELNMMSVADSYERSLLNLKQLMELPADTVLSLENPFVDDIDVEYTAVAFNGRFREALDAQPVVKQLHYRKQLAKKNIDIARSSYYPSLNLSAGYGTNYSSRATDIITGEQMKFYEQIDGNRSLHANINLQIPIFNNGRVRVEVSKAKIGFLQTENEEALVRKNLEKTISEAILDLKSAYKQYRASQTAFNTAKMAYETIKERYDVGMANSMEMFISQVNMNRSEFDTIRRKYEMIFCRKVVDFYLGNDIAL